MHGTEEEGDTLWLYCSISWIGFDFDTSWIMWDTLIPVSTADKQLGAMSVH